MTDELKIEFPVQGARQFLTSRKEMLDAFDRAKEKAKAHEVETFHGKVAEAEFRKWLSGFLPKRYSVTSGYIVSIGLGSEQKMPHYDVIIYDSLESPVLWIEDFSDTSSQGRSLAIPAEYVYCVLEVKSNFSSSTVDGAIKHLKDLLPMMKDTDNPHEKYKLYLPRAFCCGLIFFNLLQEHQHSEKALSKLITGAVELRGFFGGIILRGESHTEAMTGQLSLGRSDTPIENLFGKEKQSLLKLGMSNSVKISDNLHLIAMLTWEKSNFAQFSFDLIAMMQGTYEAGMISSFHGLG